MFAPRPGSCAWRDVPIPQPPDSLDWAGLALRPATILSLPRRSGAARERQAIRPVGGRRRAEGRRGVAVEGLVVARAPGGGDQAAHRDERIPRAGILRRSAGIEPRSQAPDRAGHAAEP